MSKDELVARAERWLECDLDPASREILRKQLDSGDVEALRAGFEFPLAFGTAGLRGEVGPGPGRINLETIAQVSWALGQYLLSGSPDASPLVVIGFDARPDSQRFAEQAARVLSGSGVSVKLTSGAQPSPLIAFAVRDLKASAGVVVTASHNPRPDNGYKLYDDQGVQIVGPWDCEITRFMANFPGSSQLHLNSANIHELETELIERYFSYVEQVSCRWVPELDSSQVHKLSYTPLHGVGLASISRAVAGLPIELLAVPSQAEPDGSFPTLMFPNPEEPGALDLLLDHAKAVGARAAAANDPDADRFALCLPLESAGLSSVDAEAFCEAELTRLSGDALGLLLADLCLKQSRGGHPCIVSTVVSTPMLEALVAVRGGQLRRTLTGFKWLCRAALEEESFVFAYEEALGYCLAGPPGSTGVMDKDGISALATVARLLSSCGGGAALARRLLGLYREFGLWGSFGHSRRFHGHDAALEMKLLLERLREKPLTELHGMKVTAVTDYASGADARPWYLGAQDLLQLDLSASGAQAGEPTDSRILIRPSGTEPKVKVYVHLRSTMHIDAQYAALSKRQSEIAAEIAAAVFDHAS